MATTTTTSSLLRSHLNVAIKSLNVISDLLEMQQMEVELEDITNYKNDNDCYNYHDDEYDNDDSDGLFVLEAPTKILKSAVLTDESSKKKKKKQKKKTKTTKKRPSTELLNSSTKEDNNDDEIIINNIQKKKRRIRKTSARKSIIVVTSSINRGNNNNDNDNIYDHHQQQQHDDDAEGEDFTTTTQTPTKKGRGGGTTTTTSRRNSSNNNHTFPTSRGTVIQICSTTNEELGRYDSARDAARQLWKSKNYEGSFDWMRQKIGGVLRGDKSSFDGYIYRYSNTTTITTPTTTNKKKKINDNNDEKDNKDDDDVDINPKQQQQQSETASSTEIDDVRKKATATKNTQKSTTTTTTATTTTANNDDNNSIKNKIQSMSLSARGFVIQYCAKTNNELCRHEKPSDAAMELWKSKGMDCSLDWIRQKISMVLRHEKKSADGYIYRYENDPILLLTTGGSNNNNNNNNNSEKENKQQEGDEVAGGANDNDNMDTQQQHGGSSVSDSSCSKKRQSQQSSSSPSTSSFSPRDNIIIQYSVDDPNKEVARFDSIAKASLDIWKSKDLKGSLDTYKRGVGQVLKGGMDTFEGFIYRYSAINNNNNTEHKNSQSTTQEGDTDQQALTADDEEETTVMNAAAATTATATEDSAVTATSVKGKDQSLTIGGGGGGNATIIQYSTADPNMEIARFDSITKAGQELWKSMGMKGSWDSTKRAVSQVLRNERESYEGYIFRYDDEVSPSSKPDEQPPPPPAAEEEEEAGGRTEKEIPTTPTSKKWGSRARIVHFDAETKEELGRYDSIIDAARERWKAKGMKGSVGSIRNYIGEVLRYKRKSWSGFIYRYDNDPELSSLMGVTNNMEEEEERPSTAFASADAATAASETSYPSPTGENQQDEDDEVLEAFKKGFSAAGVDDGSPSRCKSEVANTHEVSMSTEAPSDPVSHFSNTNIRNRDGVERVSQSVNTKPENDDENDDGGNGNNDTSEFEFQEGAGIYSVVGPPAQHHEDGNTREDTESTQQHQQERNKSSTKLKSEGNEQESSPEEPSMKQFPTKRKSPPPVSTDKDGDDGYNDNDNDSDPPMAP